MKREIKQMLVLLWLAQLLVGKVLAQSETESVTLRSKVGQIEEFSVLKTDKTVRQGPYIRYHMSGPLSGVAVYEVGSYAHGLKEGEWRCFSEHYPWNRLVSKGTYRAGLPEGQWFYYQATAVALPSRKAVLNRPGANEGFTVAIDDTAAVVQAKGFCLNGERAGLWRYYDAEENLLQAINHSTRQLVYWRPAAGPAVSGEAAAANHPLLYVGGKAQLQRDIASGLSREFLRGPDHMGSTGVFFVINNAGQQTGIQLTTKTAPTKYEQRLLAELSKVATRWLPRVTNGQPAAANYYVLLNTINKADGWAMTIEPFGD